MKKILYTEKFLEDIRQPDSTITIDKVVLVSYYRPVTDFNQLLEYSYIEGDRGRVIIDNIGVVKKSSNSFQVSWKSEAEVEGKSLIYLYYNGGKHFSVIFNPSTPEETLNINIGVTNIITIKTPTKILSKVTVVGDQDLKFLEGDGYYKGCSIFSDVQDSPVTIESFEKAVSYGDRLLSESSNKEIEGVGFWKVLDLDGGVRRKSQINLKYSDLNISLLGGKNSVELYSKEGSFIIEGTIKEGQITKDFKEITGRLIIKNEGDIEFNLDQKTGVVNYKSSIEDKFSVDIKLVYYDTKENRLIEVTNSKSLSIDIKYTSKDWEVVEEDYSYLEEGRRLFLFDKLVVGEKKSILIKTDVSSLSSGGEVICDNTLKEWFDIESKVENSSYIRVNFSIKKTNTDPSNWAPIVENKSTLIPCTIKFLGDQEITFYCVQYPRYLESFDLYEWNGEEFIKVIESTTYSGGKKLLYPTGSDYFNVVRGSNQHSYPISGPVNTGIPESIETSGISTIIIEKVSDDVTLPSYISISKIPKGTPQIDASKWKEVVKYPIKNIIINHPSTDNKVLEIEEKNITIDRYGLYYFTVTASEQVKLEIESNTEEIGYYVKYFKDGEPIDNITSDKCYRKKFYIIANPITNSSVKVGDLVAKLKISLTESPETIKEIEILNGDPKEVDIIETSRSGGITGKHKNERGDLKNNYDIRLFIDPREKTTINFYSNLKLKSELIEDMPSSITITEIVDRFDISNIDNGSRGYLGSSITIEATEKIISGRYPTVLFGRVKVGVITSFNGSNLIYHIYPIKEDPSIKVIEPGPGIQTFYLNRVGEKLSLKIESNYLIKREDIISPNLFKVEVERLEEDNHYLVHVELMREVGKNSVLGEIVIKKKFLSKEISEDLDNPIYDFTDRLVKGNQVSFVIRSTGVPEFDIYRKDKDSLISPYGESLDYFITLNKPVSDYTLKLGNTNYVTSEGILDKRLIKLTVFGRILSYNKFYEIGKDDSYTQLGVSRKVGFKADFTNKLSDEVEYSKEIEEEQEKVKYGLLYNTNQRENGIICLTKDTDVNNVTFPVSNKGGRFGVCLGNFSTLNKITSGLIGSYKQLSIQSEKVLPIFKYENPVYLIKSEENNLFFWVPENRSFEIIKHKCVVEDSYENSLLINIEQKETEAIFKTNIANGANIKVNYLGESVLTEFTEGNVAVETPGVFDSSLETNIPPTDLVVTCQLLLNPRLILTPIRDTNNGTTIYNSVLKFDPITGDREVISSVEIKYKDQTLWSGLVVQESIDLKFTGKEGQEYTTQIGSEDSPIETPGKGSGESELERVFFKVVSDRRIITLKPNNEYEIRQVSMASKVRLLWYTWTSDTEGVLDQKEVKLVFSDPTIKILPVLENIYSVRSENFEKEVRFKTVAKIGIIDEDLGGEVTFDEVTMWMKKKKESNRTRNKSRKK